MYIPIQFEKTPLTERTPTPKPMNEHPPIEERDPRDFLATRSVGDFDHAVNVYPDPPTLSTGLTLPDRLDYMQVQSLEVSRGLPPGIETRNFNFGLRDFLITIDLDPVEGTGDKRYTANIRVYGMSDTDLETALRYYEARIDYARLYNACLKWDAKDILPRWHQNQDDYYCITYPTIDLNITHYHPGQFQEHEVHFGGPHTSIVIEYWDGKAAHPGISKEEAAKLGLYYGILYNNYEEHWGHEGPLLTPNMHSDVRDSDPFTAVWVGGSLADGCSSQQQGIDTQLWLYCIAEALKTYRTRGAGVNDAFAQIIGTEFGTSQEGQ